MVDSALNKKFKLSKSENFDEFMKAIGVGLVTRKVGNSVSPVIELTKNGDEYSLSSSSTFKNTVTKFKIGEESEQETPDGRKVKSMFTQQGNTIVEVQQDPKGKSNTIERTFSPEEVKMVLKVDDIVCTRIYKPVA